MGSPPLDVAIHVASWMSSGTSSQQGGNESLSQLDHDAVPKKQDQVIRRMQLASWRETAKVSCYIPILSTPSGSGGKNANADAVGMGRLSYNFRMARLLRACAPKL